MSFCSLMTGDFKFECHTCSHDPDVPGLQSPHSPPPHPHLSASWAPVSWLTRPQALCFVLFFPQFLECSSLRSCLVCVHAPLSLPSGHLLPGTCLPSHRPNRLITSIANPSPPSQGLQIHCVTVLQFSTFISLRVCLFTVVRLLCQSHDKGVFCPIHCHFPSAQNGAQHVVRICLCQSWDPRSHAGQVDPPPHWVTPLKHRDSLVARRRVAAWGRHGFCGLRSGRGDLPQGMLLAGKGD